MDRFCVGFLMKWMGRELFSDGDDNCGYLAWRVLKYVEDLFNVSF
jgi:hypothetical protein